MRPPRLAFALGLVLAGCASSPVQTQAAASSEITVPQIARPEGETPDWWFRAGAATAHNHGAGRARARNIILFIGDGMSIPTVSAARILEGQRHGQPGEENMLSFERFPYTALSRTYNTNSQTPDSAGTMTAMVTGAKTRIGVLSVGQSAERGNCTQGQQTPLSTILEMAESAGLSTGVVTNTRLTHATPGATYAHVSERNWESDGKLSSAAREAGCRDIARQFVEFNYGDGIDVAMGGGRQNFETNTQIDPEYPEQRGARLDGRDLVQEWSTRHPEGKFVWNAQQLAALDLAHTSRLLGLFEPDHMNYEHERPQDRGGEPSLAEMTRAAITVLERNPKGYFLMVEGGRIDMAHHAGNAFRALDETIAFSDAVRAATEVSSESDTLIIVTADHSHTMTFSGYPLRGNPILGKVAGGITEDKHADLATDLAGQPYTTLNYASGPGYVGTTDQQPEGPKKFPHLPNSTKPSSGRPDLTKVDTEDPDYLQEALFPAKSETHGGDDVGVWARGPGASAVRGSIEQNVIFHFMLQSQPDLVALVCRLGDCENGVPVKRPEPVSLLRPQAR